jgi:hypothetical protein
MPIPNPNPITPGPCSQLWLCSLNVTGRRIVATLRPSDGTHLIGNSNLAVTKVVSVVENASAKALADSIFAVLQEVSGSKTLPLSVQIPNAEPNQPIAVTATFATGEPYRCADLMAIAAANPMVEAVYEQTLAFFGATP